MGKVDQAYALKVEKNLMRNYQATEKAKQKNIARMYSEWKRIYSAQGLPTLLI